MLWAVLKNDWKTDVEEGRVGFRNFGRGAWKALVAGATRPEKRNPEMHGDYHWMRKKNMYSPQRAQSSSIASSMYSSGVSSMPPML
jgi:hypothetical protein